MNDSFYKHISGKIIEVGSDEDGNYWVVGDVTEEQAMKAIHRYEKQECGLDGSELFDGDIERVEFWEAHNPEANDDWLYWRKPSVDAKSVGYGWHGSL